ncbi:MAG: hypothetical protein ACI9KE_001270 [Polyangiales bacterium]|jgi:hypothetical protein
MQELPDTDGRYLGEHIASAYDTRDDARLTFRDPRDQTGLVANIGALHQVTSAWATVLHLLSPGPTSQHPPSSRLLQMLDATRTPVALIASRWLEGKPIPPALAAAYKASIGYGQILRTWLLRGVPTEPPDLHPFLAFVDAEGWLIGKDYVCPGSRRAIAEAWTVLCGDPPNDFVEEPPRFLVEAQDATPLRDALASFEGLLFALYSHERALESLPSKPLAGVVLQLAGYVSDYRPMDATRLAADPRVADFVVELGEKDDGRALFARYASEVLRPVLGHDEPVSRALFERLFSH